MKKIIFIILAITAMSFGSSKYDDILKCNVGDEWCVYESSGLDGKRWKYGGPNADIAKLLHDPCRGNSIVAIWKDERGAWSDLKEQYTITCETGNDDDAVYWIVITPKAVRAWSHGNRWSTKHSEPNSTTLNSKAFKTLQRFEEIVIKKAVPIERERNIRLERERKLKAQRNADTYEWNQK